MQIVVHRDPDHLAESAADLIGGAISEQHERFSLGLAGGSTPIATYQALRDRDVKWSHVDAWMSDERWVPSDHPDCNGHQAARELLDHVHARFHRPRWAPWLTPADSAAHFEATLRSLHPDGRADMILLGMGSDGHTASLFPHTAALNAPASRWFIDNYVPRIDAHRLTTTFHFLRAAHRVVFLVAGSGKAEVLRSVLDPRPGEELLPAARVIRGQAQVTWLVDEAAAARLTVDSLIRR
ncbi:MAG TPA: 6-phosphogluconolactonase [Acidimicrobiia bacterium]|nr:6-phosphogluconolactonase [Acidimicrobiia bacterium]